jgi:hypothetical protein
MCGTVLPNVTTSCQHYTLNNKRWIVYPEKQTCCFCCDAARSAQCGIMKPDILKDATYKGADSLSDGYVYDEWGLKGTDG